MGHHLLADARAITAGQRRQETVLFTIDTQILGHIGAHQFHRAAIIVHMNMRGVANQGIGNSGWQISRECIILTVLAPAIYHIEIIPMHAIHHFQNIGRIGLQIAIHIDDIFTASQIKTGTHGRCLSIITA